MGLFGGGGPTVPPEQWGQGPLMPHSMAESYWDRISGTSRQEFYVVDEYAAKPKKERRGWFIFQRSKYQDNKTVREMMGEVNQAMMRRDEWARDQGGYAITRGGYGMAVPNISPGPPTGFEPTPQVYPPPDPPPAQNPQGWQPGFW